MSIAVNPFLPSYEYIPDGEPYLFGDRVYIYGSHDRFDGSAYCMNDYVCWSAPQASLADWRYEGVIYPKVKDPRNADGRHFLYAPDVQRGTDSRYYLYYALDTVGVISVAVCDTPAGNYIYYGDVHFPDGRILGETEGDVFNFDPGVFVDDDGRVYLYTGFSPRKEWGIDNGNHKFEGAYFIELEPDMLTIRQGPRLTVPGVGMAEESDFKGHEFFEASSLRKVGNQYYFIYSSIHGHELCYATSDRPDGGFRFGGTIISNGDIGLGDGAAVNYTGNNHGSIIEIGGQWYIFYHRQTNLHQHSRQACAEWIEIAADGRIQQVEMTSCGLNGGPLPGKGRYEARIACQLFSKQGAVGYHQQKMEAGIHPYFTQDGGDRESGSSQYIANFCDGSVAGFKYFSFDNTSSVHVVVRGTGEGVITVSAGLNEPVWAEIEVHPSENWMEYGELLTISKGKTGLYFRFSGAGSVDFLYFDLGESV